MRFNINVSKGSINYHRANECHDTDNCPIHTTVARLVNSKTTVDVWGNVIRFHNIGEHYYQDTEVRVADRVGHWVKDYDNYPEEAEPIKFSINIPKKYLKKTLLA